MTEEEKLKIAQVVLEALKGHEQVNVCVGNQQNNLYSCNGNIYFSPDGEPREDGGKEEDEEPPSAHSEALPPELSTAKAQAVLKDLQRIGVLDDEFQPIGLSWSESGYLAQQIAYKLGIVRQWVVFGKLWHCDRDALRSGYNHAKDMGKKIAAFEEKIKEIIS